MIWIPFRKKFEAVFSGKTHWLMKFLWFELFFVFFFLGVGFTSLREEGLSLPDGKFGSLAGFYLFFTIPLFIFLQTGEWSKRVGSMILRALVAIAQLWALVIWLIGTCVWISNLFEF